MTVHSILEKYVGMLLLYNSLKYTAFYDATASLPDQFQEIYGFNELQIGFAAIPFPRYKKLLIGHWTELHLLRRWLLNSLYPLWPSHGHELQACS